MKTDPWWNSLRVQMLLFMTLALFPLGLVAIFQTNRVATEAERNAELALQAVTDRAAKFEELTIERAFGTARFFATVAADFIDNPERCRRDLGKFVDANQQYSFIGLLPLSGVMVCTSSGATFDFSKFPDFETAMDAQEPTIAVNANGPMSRQSVFIISEPFKIDGEFAGYISISVPHAKLPIEDEDLNELGLEELMTFNSGGEILTARSDLKAASAELPAGLDLVSLRDSGTTAFHGKNARGERRTYTLVPIQGSPATVLGVWRAGDGLASDAAALVRPSVFPILMWFASMGVAMLSIYMLVTRHIVKLRRSMDMFTINRQVSAIDTSLAMPNELRALNENFDRMTKYLLHDEAELENSVREKNVLVKEIHHRVKNNLQLISSIMNMQIRSAKEEETRTVISSLQDRVRSLATIHRDLYQSQNEGMVNVGALLTEIMDNSFEIAIPQQGEVALDAKFDPVMLYPDQAVPLSLLAAEGTTNMMKYIGSSEERALPWVRATLVQEDKECELTLANSVGPHVEVESTGLGSDLIEAFAIQLGGHIEIEKTSGSYTMRVRFSIADFEPEIRDF